MSSSEAKESASAGKPAELSSQLQGADRAPGDSLDGKSQRRGGRGKRADKDDDWRTPNKADQWSEWSWNESGWQNWKTEGDSGWKDGRQGWASSDRWQSWQDDGQNAGTASSSSSKGKIKSRQSKQAKEGREQEGKGGKDSVEAAGNEADECASKGKSRGKGKKSGKKNVDAADEREPPLKAKGEGKGAGKRRPIGPSVGSGRRKRDEDEDDEGHHGEAADDVEATDAADAAENLNSREIVALSLTTAYSGGKSGKKGGRRARVAHKGWSDVTDRLAAQLGRGSYDCMICISKVHRSNHIHSCSNCWAVFHLKCIHQWIKRSSTDSGPEFEWACPGCRYHHVAELPNYTCYCGRVLRPEPSPHFLAHSCGDPCGRDRGCPHPCTEMCHPGPCPHCTGVGPPGQCHCGEEVKERTRCGEPTSWSCQSSCSGQLSCGKHQCPIRCHSGPCPSCTITSMRSCYCGAKEASRLCGQEDWTCGGICGRLLECGKHTCEKRCHDGECGPCRRDPVTWGDCCACGRNKNCTSDAASAYLVKWVGERTRCTDPLPLCNSRCGRLRPGCLHPCTRPCHEGPCGKCEELVTRECRCGKSRKELPCFEGPDYTCTQICRTKKSCGNHRCDVVCCPGHNNREHESHFCLQVCGRPLACGLHVCEDFCHLGKCGTCRVRINDPLCCACGAQSLDPPLTCGTAPPFCCEPCGGERECGHLCVSTCHFGDHPLCCELVSRMCIGGHREMQNQPCHTGRISCGEKCGRKLDCGHSCSSACHSGDCPAHCTQPCGVPRVHCEHRCESRCHPGEPCPDEPCLRKIKASCPCGLIVQEKLCGVFSGKIKSMTGSTGALKCSPACDSARNPRNTPVPASQDPVRYATDIHGLASRHKKYVTVLEDFFYTVLSSGNRAVLPPCDTSHRLLAVEYARLHWRLKTATKSDSVDGWHIVSIEPTKVSRMPQPCLSVLATSGSRPTAGLAPALGSQPVLRFVGCRGFGDELYDIVGHDGLLGIRPGQETGEVLAFMEKGSSAITIFKRLTGQDPGQWASVKGPTAGGLSVVLEQTIGVGAPSRSAPKPQPAASRAGVGGSAWGAWGAGGKASSSSSASPAAAAPAAAAPPAVPVSTPAVKAPEPLPVLDSWEDL